MPRYDWPLIRRFLTSAVESLDGRDWSDLAGQIGRFRYWEFEDYRDLGNRPR